MANWDIILEELSRKNIAQYLGKYIELFHEQENYNVGGEDGSNSRSSTGINTWSHFVEHTIRWNMEAAFSYNNAVDMLYRQLGMVIAPEDERTRKAAEAMSRLDRQFIEDSFELAPEKQRLLS